ncbi:MULTISPECIES: hypothetical protein [unclassified Streptomyces]|uniref:hypothetical protein n=1 Tax=unclassified Streptomyces TaxID=2593676 RepID=UPI00114D3A73|nr:MULTISPECIES: hypothetical protein [unclassified Streptomyces]MYS24192.1 hypothetical protein [Streptomyces sp. SID4948]
MPDVPGGLEPSVALWYNSQSVDGRTSATSPQASWTGDRCWSDATDQFTLSLNGSSNTLVHDTATGTWHAEVKALACQLPPPRLDPVYRPTRVEIGLHRRPLAVRQTARAEPAPASPALRCPACRTGGKCELGSAVGTA